MKEPEPQATSDLTIDESEPEFELGTEPVVPPTALGGETPPAGPLGESFGDDEIEPALTRAPTRRQKGPETPAAAKLDADFEGENGFDDVADEFDEPFEEPRTMPQGISARPVIIFLALVVSAYAAIAWTLRANPVLADSLFRKLPFISSLTEDRLLNRKIVLSDVSGVYQRIKDGQTVFVITGRALNNAPVTVRNIEIVGRLYDNDNRQLDEKTIFCGNVISMKILRSLTQREVSILQNLKPPKRFGIAPGEESTFVIVFMQPPSGVTEFSSQVLAVQRQA
ncbi:MAG TPA: DUF3426 domain-containing protein [Candidatus Binatia bacterium]|nr:DUF3426 domain-containing protein [Candidatus Binatia bacterium]